MRTGSKGKFAESLVLSELLKFGFRVSIPFEDYRYDLIVERNGKFKRIQVKYVGRPTKRSTIPVILHSFSRKGRRLYSIEDIDFVIVYYEPLKDFYIIPYSEVAGKSIVHLRLKEANNKQNTGVIRADKYHRRWDLIIT